MEILDHISTLGRLCKATGKWGMFIHIYFVGKEKYENIELAAAPYLKDSDEHPRVSQVIADESGFILFNTEKEMMKIYNQTVGDEGPTRTNKYNGPCRVYAITCDPDGQTGYENT